jgi:hypothetical protein
MVAVTNRQSGASSKGKLSLVDLAGSEKVKRSEVTGLGFREAVAVNKSLSALLDVIDALSQSAVAAQRGREGKGEAHVPYRNHLLTQLMRDSVGGTAKTLMFVNISPARSNLEETLGSLGYASRAALITNTIKNNAESKEIRKLKKTIGLMAKAAANKKV